MPRGKGTPGKGYANRTDLATDRAPVETGQVDPTAAGGRVAPQQAQFTRPDQIPNLTDPTRTDAPVTNGLMNGPGRGPEALGRIPNLTHDTTVANLRALYATTQSEHIRRLLAMVEEGNR